MDISPLSRKRMLAAGAFLALAACTPRSLLHTSNEGRKSSDVVYLTDVPFFINTTDQCGPAALASMLNYWGKNITPEQLKSEIYLRRLRGTLPMDMRPALNRHGLGGRVIAGSFDELKAELRAKRPVMTYMNFGTRAHPIGHFLVVIGFDDQQRGLYVHSGAAQGKFVSYRRFDRGWSGTDRWMLIAGSTISAVNMADARPVREPDFDVALTAQQHFQLGSVYETQGLEKEAAAQYKAALKRNKKFQPALMALGNLAYEKGRYHAAETYYRRVLRMNPTHGGANNNLAMIYMASGKNLKNAERLAMKAVATDYRPYAEDTLKQIRAQQKND